MPDLQRHPNVDLAVRYHRAVSRWASPEELNRFLHPDMRHLELPNPLFPEGVTRDLAGLHQAGERGRERLREQHFEVINAVAAGDQVALEVRWSGTLAVALGDLPAGHVVRAHIATFLEFRDDLICAQRNYDCYEPLRPS